MEVDDIDERWKTTETAGWGAPRDSHPHLCDDCKHRANTAQAAAADEQGHQEPVPDGGTGAARPAARPSSPLHQLRCRVHR